MDPDKTGAQLRIGQLLADRYLIEALIGRGGMAEVYKGRDERLPRPVALKVLRSHYALDPSLRARFEEEARAAAIVSHPNVVAVYDAGEDDSKAFIVMELVSGQSLQERIEEEPLDPTTARSVGAQVLDALAAAHAKGVLHRDIKPANVLLTPEGEAKVADFGIAKAIHPSPDSREATTVNMVLGTPSYLAPERAQGLAATVASDLWSVGVLLYECLSGVKPFAGDNAIAVTLAAAQGRYVPIATRRPDVDAPLAALITRALDPDPDRRFSSAASMADELREPSPDATLFMAGKPADATELLSSSGGATTVLAGAGGLAAAGAGGAALAGSSHETTGSQRPSRSRRRGTAVLAGLALALLAGAAIAVALLVPGSGSHNPAGGASRHRSGSKLPKSSTSLPASSLPTSSTRPSVAPMSTVSTTSTSPGSTSTTTSTTSTSTTTTSTTTTTTSTTTTTTTVPAATPSSTAST